MATTPTIKNQMATGASWMLFLLILDKGIGLIGTTILARLLVPADFGLVALAMPIIAFLEMIAEAGFGVVLIQKRELSDELLNTAWTLNAILRLGAACILLILAYPASLFFEEPHLTSIFCLLALNFALIGIQNIGIVTFRKNFEFHKEFGIQLSKRLAGFIVTVIIAFVYRSFWAMLIGTFVSNIVFVILSYILHPYRPKLSLEKTSELFHFSKWLLINRFLGFINMKSIPLFIGKKAGANSLGIYTLASEIAEMVTMYIVAPINTAVFSGYAIESHSKDLLRDSYLRVISMLLIIILPLSLGLYLVAHEFVLIWLGETWLPTVPVIRILTLRGLCLAIMSNVSYIFLALGKPNYNAFLNFISTILLILLMLVLIPKYGALGAAWALLITSLFIFIPVFYTLGKELGFETLLQLLTKNWRIGLSSLVMVFSVKSEIVTKLFPSSDIKVILASNILTGAFAYVVCILALWHISGRPGGPEKFILDKVSGLLSRKA